MPAAPAFDLQSHSTCSDGALPAAEVVERAAAAGVELLALTDHDAVHGVDDALAAAERHGIRLVPATEISAVHEDREDLHVLGYLVDHRDDAFLAKLEHYRGDRGRRATGMIERLRDELGFQLDTAVIEDRRSRGLPIGRPHLAGAVLEHPANQTRLQTEGIPDTGHFIASYLIQGKPGYVRRTTPTVEEAIATIHDAGGVAVWAHPFWDVDDPDQVLALIDLFRTYGLDGVEVFYATHTREQAELLADHCAKHGLLATGSADFHGPEHPNFARFRAFETYGREPVLGPIADAIR